MDITTILFLLCVGLFLFGAAKYRAMQLELVQLRTLLNAPTSSVSASNPSLDMPPSLDATMLNRAGTALKNPPHTLSTTLQVLRQKLEPRLYRFPLGWYASVQGAELQTARFMGDVNHILLTGQSDSGKDNAALNMLLSLAHTHSPEQVQFAILDGKGLDWIGWQKKAHCWHVATDPEHIGAAMEQLTAERKRRRDILANAGVSKWDNYQGRDLSLLVVFISELLLLENAVGSKSLTNWLNAELTAARAFGIRFIIATQTASNFSTQWRSQISLFMAGFQPSASQDAPNCGLTTNEITALDGIAPSNLPAPSSGAGGVFCLIQGTHIINVRTSLINDQQRDYMLAQLPDKQKNTLQPASKKLVPVSQQNTPASANTVLLQMLHNGQPFIIKDEVIEHPIGHPIGLSSGKNNNPIGLVEQRRTFEDSRSTDTFDTSYIELPLPAEAVPFAEQRRILETAPTVKSKRQLSLKLYEVDGGEKYKWVRMVCDATGLLQSSGASQ